MQVEAMLKPRLTRVEKKSPAHLRLTLEPLERGFGHTLGNALRRVLMSSVSGGAVVSVRIEGAFNEYTALGGVQEDIPDIILNLKGLAVKMGTDSSVEINIQKKGPGVVTGADVEAGGAIEIFNKDHHIVGLAENGEIDMTLVVENGRGYRAASAKGSKDDEKTIGIIEVDANFNPVIRVSYSVEGARVERRTDLDKLIIDMETNGTVEPEEVLRTAATILTHQLSEFVQFDGKVDLHDEAEVAEIDPILTELVERLNLGARLTNSLKAEKILFIGDLVIKSEKDLLKTPNLGKKSVVEIERRLKEHTLELNMDISWPPPKLWRERREPLR